MKVLEYEQFWTSLGQWGEKVRAERISNSGGADKKEGDVNPVEGEEKVVKTDKVIVGNKISWAVAQAIGEVSYCFMSNVCYSTDNGRITLMLGDL